MSRIPYVPADIQEPADIVGAVRARRGGGLINLDRVLLHSPELALGWNHLLGAVRTRLGLNPRLRELAMCIVAVLNGAEYEFIHHAPEFIKAGGGQAQVTRLRSPEEASLDMELFDETERATIALSIEMTRHVKVSDTTFARISALLDRQSLVELIATIAAYNMVSRFLVAAGVTPED
jgi:alkylhydroperoxidase family enzyme